MNEVVIFGDSHILVRNMGYTHTGENWIHPDRLLDYNVFIYVIKGCMQVYEDGTEYLLYPGNTFFLKSGIHHWGAAKTLKDTETCWIHFYDSPYKGNLNRNEMPGYSKGLMFQHKSYDFKMTLPKLYQVKNMQFMLFRLKTLYEQFLQQDYTSLQSLCLNVTELFTEIYRQSIEKKLLGKSEAIAQNLVAYLENHFNCELNSQQISSHFKLNYNYLSTIFKKNVGMSIFEYHAHARIRKASEMLKSTRFNISEVSRSVGYDDPLYFSKVFKKVMGESPSQYLKSFYIQL